MKGLKIHLPFTAGALLMALVLVGVTWVICPAVPVSATPLPQDGGLNNEACLACHAAPDQSIELSQGEMLDISVEPEMFASSTHFELACTQCHTTIKAFPHPQRTEETRRDYQLAFTESCKTCHEEQYTQVTDSIHGEKLSLAGDPTCPDCGFAPTCADCHDPHTQHPVRDASGNLLAAVRHQTPLTCAKCHNTIFEEYKNSVHGSGILEENNPDVASCTDCHGVHTIGDPTTAAFRNSSIQLCANCHTDAAIMDKYGISTNVLNTYVADFHGTTVTLFERQNPDELTNKAVCYDCHGIHGIYAVDDPQKGLSVKQNMLVACQRCHPDATENFPDSWLSHYIPSPDKYPLVYYVELFYKILIPTVLGGMVVIVLSDVTKRTIFRKKKGHEPTPVETSSELEPTTPLAETGEVDTSSELEPTIPLAETGEVEISSESTPTTPPAETTETEAGESQKEE